MYCIFWCYITSGRCRIYAWSYWRKNKIFPLTSWEGERFYDTNPTYKHFRWTKWVRLQPKQDSFLNAYNKIVNILERLHSNRILQKIFYLVIRISKCMHLTLKYTGIHSTDLQRWALPRRTAKCLAGPGEAISLMAFEFIEIQMAGNSGT